MWQGIAGVHPRDEEMSQFLVAADTEDVGESGLTEITSPAFAVREDGQVAAAAGIAAGLARWRICRS